VEERGNSEVPSSVSGHEEAKRGPDSVVVEGRDKYSGGTACSKDISPSPLIQIIIYVIYVAAKKVNHVTSPNKLRNTSFIHLNNSKNQLMIFALELDDTLHRL